MNATEAQSRGERDDKIDYDPLTHRIIGCALEVHNRLGPGLLESLYQSALCIEFGLNKLAFECQKAIAIDYKGAPIGEYRVDLIVEDQVIVEIKSVERFDPVFEAQLLSYLKVTGKKTGLLINFNSRLLRDGIKRYVL